MSTVVSKAITVATVLAALTLVAAGSAVAQSDGGSTTVPSIELSGEISPATAGWIGHALDEAADNDAPLVIIRMDTPGGLDSSMRDMVKDIVAAPMPVVVYVSPNGSRAASAGLFITQAADVAAMAPETNIGSASPITSTGADIGDTLGRKITNDASAFVRALATVHGRDPDLAEQMVREATNVTASEALDANLIDLVASDQEDLLSQLNGFEVKGPKAATLDTTGLTIEQQDMPFQYDLLQILVDPNVAFLLLLIGFVGIALEFFAPGTILPGSVGIVSLLLGIFGTVQLPVAAIGVVLLVLGIGLIIAEAHLPTAGLLGIAGVGVLIAGGLLLFGTGDGDPEVNPVLVVIVALAFGGGMVAIGQRALAARHRPVVTGEEDLLGSTGEVRTPIDPLGQVWVGGALWRATAIEGAPIEVGYRVRVEGIDGLTLSVSPLESGPSDALAEPARSQTERT